MKPKEFLKRHLPLVLGVILFLDYLDTASGAVSISFVHISIDTLQHSHI